jgi:zinc protease
MATSLHIPVELLSLSNGLRLVLSEDHTAPVVAVNLWYHVGSANEPPGRTGFAHLFEHMLFQGSAHVRANEHFELIQGAGGTLNGSTWLDRTNYFETVPANHLALTLWLEADRMSGLLSAMTQEKLDTQRDVVKNERRWTVDNQPYGSWWEVLPALCFPVGHPFHHSLMGSMEDLSAASLENVADFFRDYYTPDNAVLTVVGDFDRQETERLVTSFFGGIPSGRRKPPLAPMDVPAVFGAWHHEAIPDNVVVPRVFLAFRTPTFGSDGYFAASLYATILGAQRGCRLHRVLVRERQLASVATAFTFDLAKGSDLLVLDVTARPGVTAAGLEAAVAEVVDELAASGPNEEELQRAKALVETDFVSAMQTAADRADRLSQFMTYFNNPAQVNEHISRYESVQLSQMREFAAAFLRTNNRVSLIYVPRDLGAP